MRTRHVGQETSVDLKGVRRGRSSYFWRQSSDEMEPYEDLALHICEFRRVELASVEARRCFLKQMRHPPRFVGLVERSLTTAVQLPAALTTAASDRINVNRLPVVAVVPLMFYSTWCQSVCQAL